MKDKINLRIPLGTYDKTLAVAYRKIMRKNWKKNGWTDTTLHIVFRGRGKRHIETDLGNVVLHNHYNRDLPVKEAERVAIYIDIKSTIPKYKCEFCGEKVEKGFALCDKCFEREFLRI